MSDLCSDLRALAVAVAACEWELPITAVATCNAAATAIERRPTTITTDTRCPFCGGELSYCDEGINSKGPTWGCLVCLLREKLASLAEAGTGYSQETMDAMVEERAALMQELAESREALRFAKEACSG